MTLGDPMSTEQGSVASHWIDGKWVDAGERLKAGSDNAARASGIEPGA
jgi:hypothetical protein